MKRKVADAIVFACMIVKYCCDVLLIALFYFLIVPPYFSVVITDRVKWALWQWCYKRKVYQYLSLKNDTIAECYYIYPGDSPAYYEVVRFFCVMSFILPLLNFLSIRWRLQQETSNLCLRILYTALEVLQSLSVLTTLAVLGAYYKDDPRWKDANPSLDCVLWMIVFVLVFHFPASFFMSFAWFSGPNFVESCMLRRPQWLRKPCLSNASSTPSRNENILRTRLSKAFITALKRCYLSMTLKLHYSGSVEEPPVNPLRPQPDYRKSTSNPATSTDSVADTVDNQPGRVEGGKTGLPTSENSTVNGDQPGRMTRQNTSNEDCLHSDSIQQNIQQELSVMDSSSPGVHCTLVDLHCELDPPTGHLVFQLKRPEEMCAGPDVSSYI